MKRFLVFLMAALVPALAFAQLPQDKGAAFLKRLNLSDAQISQVQGIEKSTVATIKGARVHLRLLRAQINEALLPSNAKPDTQAINRLIDQQAQLRADMEKALVAARIQLAQIMGQETFDRYAQVLRRHWDGQGPRGMGQGRGQAGRGSMMGDRPKMGPPPVKP
ncbi:MAG: hypothetical protein WCL50_03800 [Spirochaetota bacterium]